MELNINFKINLPNKADMPTEAQILEWLKERLNVAGDQKKITKKHPLFSNKLTAEPNSIFVNVPPQQDDKYETNFSEARKILAGVFGKDKHRYEVTSTSWSEMMDYKLGEGGVEEFVGSFGPNHKFLFYVNGYRSLIEGGYIRVAVETTEEHASIGHDIFLSFLKEAFKGAQFATIDMENPAYEFLTETLEYKDPVAGLQALRAKYDNKKLMFVAGDAVPLIDELNQVKFAIL